MNENKDYEYDVSIIGKKIDDNETINLNTFGKNYTFIKFKWL
jgi:hypothetical protein